MRVDPFYTPSWLAAEMAAELDLRTGSLVADFTAGGGALLDAAEQRFGSAFSYLAADCDRRAVARLRSEHPRWLVGRADLLNERSLRQSPVWARRSAVSGVLVNPPFSYRGGAGMRSPNGSAVVSPAAACLETILSGMSPGSSVVALMPRGSRKSEKDRKLWQSWERRHALEVLRAYSRGAFPGAYARTEMLRFTVEKGPGVAAPSRPGVNRIIAGCTCIDIIRGRVPVHRRSQRESGPLAAFVHTTSLQEGEVELREEMCGWRWATPGPLVLLPRVGRFTPGKIAVWSESASVVLSDCMLAMRPLATPVDVLVSSLMSSFGVLAERYGGSCAPYLTVAALEAHVAELGYSPRRAQAGGPSELCSCGGGSAVMDVNQGSPLQGALISESARR
ncbi:hypothetical protein SAMN05660991_00916 [Trujillonella endophytica]|uniref:Methyltransferase domain-containing protein n=1 Tax=Trujillonella endophytica TaxID=673521 RepID=A0A1H8R001_9ACTN|nr:hypothetical protein SAMN05660991_00916 [Trujillella endophytica]